MQDQQAAGQGGDRGQVADSSRQQRQHCYAPGHQTHPGCTRPATGKNAWLDAQWNQCSAFLVQPGLRNHARVAPALSPRPLPCPSRQVDLDGIPALSRGRAQIDVLIEISALNEVTLSVTNRSTGSKVTQSLSWYQLVLVDNEPDNSNVGKEILPAESEWPARLAHCLPACAACPARQECATCLACFACAYTCGLSCQVGVSGLLNALPACALALLPALPSTAEHCCCTCPHAAAADLMKGGEATVGHGVYSNTAVTNVAAVSAADAVPNAWGGVSSPYGAAPMTPFSPGEEGLIRFETHRCLLWLPCGEVLVGFAAWWCGGQV